MNSLSGPTFKQAKINKYDSKKNEAIVLQNCQKIIYLSYISRSFFLIITLVTHFAYIRCKELRPAAVSTSYSRTSLQRTPMGPGLHVRSRGV